MSKAKQEIEKLSAELEWLAGVNNSFGVENEKLQAEIDRIKRYRVPISARSSPEVEEVKVESSSSKRPRSRSRSRSGPRKSRRTDKGKGRMSETEAESSDSEDEIDEKEARVRNLTKIRNAILDFFFYLMIKYII